MGSEMCIRDRSGGHVLLFGLPLCRDRLKMAPISAYEPCDSLVDYVPYAASPEQIAVFWTTGGIHPWSDWAL